MKIITISNHKGGTGKTSININLGVYFAKKNLKVLIIDMDPQGHIAPGFGLDISYDDKSIADILTNQEDISNIIISTKIPNLDIAPSNIKLSNVNEILHNTFKRETRLKKSLKGIMNRYDLIFIDSPPSLGPLVENALIVSDYCLIPCEPSGRSIDGLADFISKINEVREGELDNRWHIVLSRVKRSARLTNEVITHKMDEIKNRILETKIYESEAINQAQIAGIPLFDFPRGRSASENFTMLGKEVADKCQIS